MYIHTCWTTIWWLDRPSASLSLQWTVQIHTHTHTVSECTATGSFSCNHSKLYMQLHALCTCTYNILDICTCSYKQVHVVYSNTSDVHVYTCSYKHSRSTSTVYKYTVLSTLGVTYTNSALQLQLYIHTYIHVRFWQQLVVHFLVTFTGIYMLHKLNTTGAVGLHGLKVSWLQRVKYVIYMYTATSQDN